MATAESGSLDPLILLRTSLTTGPPPRPSTSSETSISEQEPSLAQASYFIFSRQDNDQPAAISLTEPTRFNSTRGQVDVRSVYLCWLNKDESTVNYINAVTALAAEIGAAGKSDKVVNLSLEEKSSLCLWLAGDIGLNDCEYIQPLDGDNQAQRTDGATAGVVEGGDVEMKDAGLTDIAARKRKEDRLREIYAAERKMGDRNTVLHGIKIQDFSKIRDYTPLFLGRSKTGPQQPQAPALTNNPALRPPQNQKPGRRPDPIILLSPSASSLLRMPNIKSFLAEGIYTSPDTSTSGINILRLQRVLPSISSHPLLFTLVDSPDNFRPDYWNRVVAVFTTGQTWQFKNYKWQNPAELFAHALGVYVGWRGEVVPDTVKGWGRGVLTVQIDKGTQRWRDREVVEDIWSAIESRMKAQGWGKDGR
jgi:parafibromin